MFLKKIKLTSRHWILLVLLALILGGLGGWLIGRTKGENAVRYANSLRPLRSQNSKYKYTSPLLAYDSAESTPQFSEYTPLESKVKDLIKQKTDSQAADHISVYFRDLNQGRWVGINENDAYDPASLLKVPLMIAYLKEAESDPGLLDRKLTFTPQMNTESIIPFETPTKLQIGSSYTVDQLLTAMVGDSDNGAKDVLLDTVDQNSLNETYTDLGIVNPNNVQGNYLISPKIYSLFFRVLYNATYLNPDMSEKGLQLLSLSDFAAGLVAGVPRGTQTAQKYGEHVNVDSKGQPLGIELHDCGIIYAPKNPYILCIMTKGSDPAKLTQTISDVSKLIYDEVTKLNK